MAEVVGLVASCVSVAGLAAAILTLTEDIKSLARDYKKIRSDVSSTLRSVKYQANVIRWSQEALTNYCNNTSNQSARAGHQCESSTINFLRFSNHSNYIQIESTRIQDDVNELSRHVRNIDTTMLRIVTVFAWRRVVKKGFEAIRNELLYVQQNISLIYNIVRLEAELRREERDLVEIENLKKIIRVKERDIKSLRKHRRREGFSSSDYDDSAESLLEEKGLETVLDIARTVRKEEKLPDFVDARPLAPQPSPPPRSSPAPDIQPSSEQNHVRFEMPHNSRVQSAASQIEYPPLLIRRESSPSETESGNSESAQTASPASSTRRSQRSVSPPGTSTTSRRSRSSTQSVPEAERPPSPAENPHGHGDFIAVRPADMVLKMIKSRSYERIPGQIKSFNGTAHEVRPILEPQQDFNFMTEHEARRLDLMDDVEPYDIDAEGERWIECANGRKIRPTGKVLVRWSTTMGLRPITLQFWVFPGYQEKRSIVLGKPYVEKTSYYSAPGPSRSSD